MSLMLEGFKLPPLSLFYKVVLALSSLFILVVFVAHILLFVCQRILANSLYARMKYKDPSAVHLDILDAEILGINMAVGINGCIGKPMIREGRDIHVYVRRSLRDVFRKVPNICSGSKGWIVTWRDVR
ncbi:hypothetical protein HAX54_045891 [Datura stramonium]|uniref:Uncharacterized protein n=1 Tax=Datura stramonium TaxID=4076 RepID=A0ABS8SQP7_DATST|nr:hypothetical protein [Datura stramonium]